MKLEQAIQQTDFRSTELKLSLNLIYTFNWYAEAQKQYFATYGITQQQYNVLRILRGRFPEPYSTSQIRDRMLDKMSDVSRIVDRLLKKDLVLRNTSASDRRLVDVIISDKGLLLLDQMDDTIEQNAKQPFTNFSEEEKLEFYRLLDKIREN
jgi:MarR family 2-MHQ and catechol resistance regulon transcriptional repressor